MNIFLDYGEKARFLIKMLTIMVIIEFAIIIIFAFSLTKRNIVYINPSYIVGKTQVGYIPNEYAEQVALLFINYLGNFSSLSVKKQFYNAFVLEGTDLQSKNLNTLKREAQEIESSGIVVQTTPVESKVEKEGATFRVSVKAHRVSFVSGFKTSEKEVQYIIFLKQKSPTKENPLGMEVINYEYQILRDITGNTSNVSGSSQ